MTTTQQTAPIAVGTKVVIAAGCKALDINKNVTAKVVAIQELGAEGGHFVKVTLQFLNGFQAGKSRSLYARHINRLSDPIVNLNDGNPCHKVQIRKY